MHHWKRACAVLLTCSWMASCVAMAPVRVLTPSDQLTALPRNSPYLKAHTRDGRLYVFSHWIVDEAEHTVSGQGRSFAADRHLLAAGELRLRADEVALFETNVPTRSVTVGPLAVVTGVSLVMTAYCAVNPKACFGSCPTFYAGDGEERLLLAEGFSDSVAPSLEATDLDALYRAHPRERRFRLEMTNEALETHVVRYVDLLAARRPHGGRVLASADGKLWAAGAPRPPLGCNAAEGDCLEPVAEADGHERFSRTDGQDLARRESIDLEFETQPGEATGLVIGARQTLLSTYLLYQTLSYMGQDAGRWLSRVERGDERVRKRARMLRDALGGIEVLVRRGDGRFTRVAEIQETGPLASDFKIVPLPPSEERLTHVRLRLTRGHWRIDSLALAALLGPTQAQRLKPLADGSDAVATPPWPLTTLPGDRHTFTFELPEEPEGLDLFLSLIHI